MARQPCITCIGLDLAWAPRNPTGAATIRGTASGGLLHNVALLHDDAQILAYIIQAAQTTTVLLAIDAPLRVPNTHGRRPAEAELGRVFAPYEAGAHPANRTVLAGYNGGAVRGEVLVAALEQHGFRYTPALVAGAPARQVAEVYPHAAMVALFGLVRTLKYKARPRRGYAQRWHAWQHYQAHLRTLQTADPFLRGTVELLSQPVEGLRGQRLKHYEDQIDAVMCAYIALYAFRWGAQRCRTFGTLEGGSIFTPVPLFSGNSSHARLAAKPDVRYR